MEKIVEGLSEIDRTSDSAFVYVSKEEVRQLREARATAEQAQLSAEALLRQRGEHHKKMQQDLVTGVETWKQRCHAAEARVRELTANAANQGAGGDEGAAPSDGDFDGLRRHDRKLLHEKKQLAERNRELEQQLIAVQLAARKQDTPPSAVDDFLRANASRLSAFQRGSPEWQAEHDKIIAEAQPLIVEAATAKSPLAKEAESLRADVVRLMRASEANRIVREIARPDLTTALLPHIEQRISVEQQDDGAWQISLKDGRGKATSVEGLRDELGADSAFAPFVRGMSDAEKTAHARKVAEMLGQKSAQPRKLTREKFDDLEPDARVEALRGGAEIAEH